jgi:hypothetical protein
MFPKVTTLTIRKIERTYQRINETTHTYTYTKKENTNDTWM